MVCEVSLESKKKMGDFKDYENAREKDSNEARIQSN